MGMALHGRQERRGVDYATGSGTATAGSDYTSTSGTLTFAAGETSKTVSVPVLADAVNEGSARRPPAPLPTTPRSGGLP